MGRQKDSELPLSWVMTINKTYDEVTFWDASVQAKYVLKGRVAEGEEGFLKAYLKPKVSEKERNEFAEERERRR